MRITVSMPCYGRPKRTIRAIENICTQNINGWEALVVGDGCRHMEEFLKSDECKSFIEFATNNGNSLIISNNLQNKGYWGYDIINQNIQRASGNYFIFVSNDDVILQNHFENYLSQIENTENDFVYCDTYIVPQQKVRVAQCKEGYIGHSELIVKTDFLKRMPPHIPRYGHDWDLVNAMIKSGAKYAKSTSKEHTYMVMGLGEMRDDIID